MIKVIELREVSKKYGDFKAVSDISFTINKGEIVGFVGENGAGKTTTISAILGFISASSGQVKLMGRDVSPSSAHKNHDRLGFASGDMELPGGLTGKQFLDFVQGIRSASTKTRYKELVDLFKPQLDKKISELSRGNKQKIALISAFLFDPEIVILDEPTSGLDPIMQEKFLELIRSEGKAGKTVFMSSHYLSEVVDVCSRVILLSGGKIVRDELISDLLVAGGKKIRIITGNVATQPPKTATHISINKIGKKIEMTFVFSGLTAELQVWVAGLKQLQNIEITENSFDNLLELYDGKKR